MPETALKLPPTTAVGRVRVFQLVPSQWVAKGAPCSLPTAQTSSGESAVRPRSTAPPLCAAVRVGCQLWVFQCRMSPWGPSAQASASAATATAVSGPTSGTLVSRHAAPS